MKNDINGDELRKNENEWMNKYMYVCMCMYIIYIVYMYIMFVYIYMRVSLRVYK